MPILEFFNDPRWLIFWERLYRFVGFMAVWGAVGFFIATARSQRNWKRHGDKLTEGMISERDDRIKALESQLTRETVARKESEDTIRSMVSRAMVQIGAVTEDSDEKVST